MFTQDKHLKMYRVTYDVCNDLEFFNSLKYPENYEKQTSLI